MKKERKSSIFTDESQFKLLLVCLCPPCSSPQTLIRSALHMAGEFLEAKEATILRKILFGISCCHVLAEGCFRSCRLPPGEAFRDRQ